MTPRLLTISDLPQALELSSSAGWNQTVDDWRRLIELAPETCFGIELDGCLAATATLLSYGRRLAWLGMVLTRRDYQRRGLARQLMTHTLETARTLGIETVKLDATDQGQPLYEKLGFVVEQRIERWSSNGRWEENAGTGSGVALDSLAGLDHEAFGVERMRLLSRLAADCVTTPLTTADGFAFWVPGRVANHLGPCVARTSDAARSLIATCLAQTTAYQEAEAKAAGLPATGQWIWDVLPDNTPAIELARQFGFQPARRLVRMRLGPLIAERSGLVYATAGFALG